MSLDRELERRLIDMPLPDGLLDRLRSIADEGALSDGEIDLLLCNTPVPVDLVERLLEMVEEEALDELLTSAPAPPSRLAVRLRTLPFERRSSPLVRWAVAASLFCLLCGAEWAVVGGVIASLRPRPLDVELMVVDQGPLQLVSPLNDIVLTAPVTDQSLPAPKQAPNEALSWLASFDEPRTGPAGALFMQLESDGFFDDVFLLEWGFLGAPSLGDDNVPELMTVSLPRPRGVEPPLVRGYDRKFLLREKCSPPISPGAHPKLRVAKAPLTTSTASYDLTRRASQNNRFPDVRDVRIEDFLAAMPYEFARPANRSLALHAAAGPSRFSKEGAGLLQLGVQAGAMPNRKPVHLTVAIDISASMRWGAQLDQTRLAVARLLGHLRGEDQLTIVVFDDQPLTLVEQVSREQIGDVKRMLSHLRPRGGTNLALGMQHAVAEAFRGESKDRENILLVVTDAGDALDDETLSKTESLLGQATSGGLRLSIFDWNGGESTSPMEGCMVRCGGEYHRLLDSDSLGWRMVDALAQRSSLIARDAKLTVDFNPKSVAFYRLLGHQTDALAGLSPIEPKADFRALENTSTLFEIALKPGGERKIGVAKLEWTDPKTGKLRRVQRVLQRDLFVNSFAGAPPELQAATLAAEAAEIVGRNYFGQNQTRNLREVLRAYESVHPDLKQRAEFAEFADLLRKLEEIRIRRGTR